MPPWLITSALLEPAASLHADGDWQHGMAVASVHSVHAQLQPCLSCSCTGHWLCALLLSAAAAASRLGTAELTRVASMSQHIHMTQDTYTLPCHMQILWSTAACHSCTRLWPGSFPCPQYMKNAAALVASDQHSAARLNSLWLELSCCSTQLGWRLQARTHRCASPGSRGPRTAS